jgi:hypothetical protein
MQRRTFLGMALAVANASPLFAALEGERWDDAAEVLERATAEKQVDSAVLHVVQKDERQLAAGPRWQPIPSAATGDERGILPDR